jgi:hypothetical protein
MIELNHRSHNLVSQKIQTMKPNENKPTTFITASEAALLSSVAAKLKGQVFFPQKVAAAKEYLKKLKSIE